MKSAPSQSNSSGSPDDIARIAAEWVLRRQEGLSFREERELRRWLERDPRHAAMMEEMDETSSLLDKLRAPEAEIISAPRTSWYVRAGMLAAAIAIIGWVTWTRVLPNRAAAAYAVSTEVGGMRELKLPDGSVVLLNTDTAIRVRYRADERRVSLGRGEAFFTVAKDASRPFWVDAESVSVRAVGTAFNVRQRTQTVEVLVTEGKVSVDQRTEVISDEAAPGDRVVTPANPQFVVAGQLAKITIASSESHAAVPIEISELAAPRAESALAWQVRRLEFSDTPLSEVVAEFNRYNRHKLVIGDPELGRQTFGGVFAPSGYNSLVEVLQQSFGVSAECGENETVLRKAPR